MSGNPNGWFKKSIGILLTLAGLIILTGFDRTIQQYVIEHGYLDVTHIETYLLR